MAHFRAISTIYKVNTMSFPVIIKTRVRASEDKFDKRCAIVVLTHINETSYLYQKYRYIVISNVYNGG